MDKRLQIEEENNEQKILAKINNLQKKILDFLNAKLSIHLTGNEIKVDLNGKNIGNVELMLLSGIQFTNLEELILSNNNISDITPLKEFNLNKLKNIDLSSNKIKKNRSIKNTRPIIDNKNNNKIKKDIEEIKDLIKYNNSNDNEGDNGSNNYNNLYQNKDKKNENKIKLLNKINSLEKKILEYFNSKLNIKLTGKEIIIDLNNKNIGNLELNLLSGVEFENLEEINLSHNNILNH